MHSVSVHAAAEFEQVEVKDDVRPLDEALRISRRLFGLGQAAKACTSAQANLPEP
jgi:hypothetical protein